ncbi:MAG: hypothetical protein F6K31_24805 [Symploca sp. SIO2G7]|nr:hypothetical protein [Symploca sp. SIO2G7]
MSKPSQQPNAKKARNFASFDLPQAFKHLGIKKLQPWNLPVESVPPSNFFKERLERLQRLFDLRNYEESKKLLIDAFCEEALMNTQHLKVWKGAALKATGLNGNVDYLIAENKDYLEAPLLCIVEAKKDDFEQGLAQCLVEMQACQESNINIDSPMDVFGIVTNGETWRFYKLTVTNEVYETLPHSIGEQAFILGMLQRIFNDCEANLLRTIA